MARLKFVTKDVSVDLNQEEIRSRSQRMATVSRLIREKKLAAKNAAAAIMAEVKELVAEHEKLEHVVETGKEERPVKCREEFNYERSIVEYIRVDNDEVAGHRPMTNQEKQTNIPGTEKHTGGPAIVDEHGEIHPVSLEVAQAVRNALNNGEQGVKVPIEGKGDVFARDVMGDDGESGDKPAVRRGRKPKAEAN